MTALRAGSHLPGPGFVFRCCVCVWQLPQLLPAGISAVLGLWGTHTPRRGSEGRPGGVMELHWSRKYKTEEDLACWHFWTSSKSLSLGGSLARAVCGCAGRFGDSSVPLCHRAGQGPQAAPLSVHRELCLHPHPHPCPDCSSGKPGVLHNPKCPGGSPEVTPPGEAEMTEQHRELWKWSTAQTRWF